MTAAFVLVLAKRALGGALGFLANPIVLLGAAALALFLYGQHVGAARSDAQWQGKLHLAVEAARADELTIRRAAEAVQAAAVTNLLNTKTELEAQLEEYRREAFSAPDADRMCLDPDRVRRLNRIR